MTKIIGLTGGIATGKSTVAKMFIEEKIPVISADDISRKLAEKGKAAYEKIVSRFGSEILLATGNINRKKLGEIIFADEKKRGILNSVIHPLVKKEIAKEIKLHKAAGTKFVALDVPLLYECEYDEICDMVTVVFTDENTQLHRLMKRDNLSRENAKKRVDAQMSLREKIDRAHFKIDNSLSILETKNQFNKLLEYIQRL